VVEMIIQIVFKPLAETIPAESDVSYPETQPLNQVAEPTENYMSVGKIELP